MLSKDVSGDNYKFKIVLLGAGKSTILRHLEGRKNIIVVRDSEITKLIILIFIHLCPKTFSDLYSCYTYRWTGYITAEGKTDLLKLFYYYNTIVYKTMEMGMPIFFVYKLVSFSSLMVKKKVCSIDVAWDRIQRRDYVLFHS